MAPQHEIYELYRDYAQLQLEVGNGKAMVVSAWTKRFACSNCTTLISSLFMRELNQWRDTRTGKRR